MAAVPSGGIPPGHMRTEPNSIRFDTTQTAFKKANERKELIARAGVCEGGGGCP